MQYRATRSELLRTQEWPLTGRQMPPDKRIPRTIPDKRRRGLETSVPDVALSAKEEWEQEPVSAEAVTVAAANRAAPRHRRSPCSRQDLMSGRDRKWRTFISPSKPLGSLQLRKGARLQRSFTLSTLNHQLLRYCWSLRFERSHV